MEYPHGSYLSKRLLRFQVGFLLSEGPGSVRAFPLDFPQRLQIDAELFVESLAGELILTRTKDGILLQGHLRIRHLRHCDRCLDAFVHEFALDVAELFTALPDAGKSVFSIDGSGEIDLAPLLREEILIEVSYRAICQADCYGLNAETGDRLNGSDELTAQEAEAGAIDPRMAVLKRLLV